MFEEILRAFLQYVYHYLKHTIQQEQLRKGRSLPVEVGRLADAAGEEKSAKPPMRSELPPDEETPTNS